MPNYITDNDTLFRVLSEKELAELSTDEAELDPDDSILTECINAAESLIDTFISTQVSTPLDNPSAFIQQATLDLAKYFLFMRRHHVSEEFERMYERYVSTSSSKPGWLWAMSMGKLPVDANLVERSGVDFGSDKRLFNDHMTGV